MNTKFLLVPFLSLVFLGNVAAQDFDISDETAIEIQDQPAQQGAFKTTFKKNKLRDNWIFSIGSGAQVLFAEDDSKGNFSDRITYAPTFSVAKYFSPIWGLRASFTGGSLHGFNDGDSGTYTKWNNGEKYYQGAEHAGQPGYPNIIDSKFFTWDPSWTYRGWGLGSGINDVSGQYKRSPGAGEDLLYMQHVRYVAANFDFMFDLRTLFGKYDHKRFFELTPYAGIGYYHIFPHMGSEARDLFGIHGGLVSKFRISDKIHLFAEVSGHMLPEEFDGHIGDDVSFDGVGQALAGISFNIGKTKWDVAEPMNYELVNDLMNKINDLQTVAAIPCPDCPPCPPVGDPSKTLIEEGDAEPKKSTFFLPDPVFFRIDKSVIDASEWEKIEKAANYLNQYPDAKVVVTGYADKKTAYPSYNLKLSERRSKIVAKALATKYGINPARISIDWEGDKIQPFDINEWNRVVIFVIE